MAKAPAEIRSLCRGYTEQAVRIAAGIMVNSEHQGLQLQALEWLMDRGWGKATQPIGGDPTSPIVVNIIQKVRAPK